MTRGGLTVLSVGTFLLFVGMVGGFTGPMLREAEGLLPFDLRPGGYTPADVPIYIDALSAHGRRLYFWWIQPLDTIFPICLALSLTLVARRVLARWSAQVVAVLALTGMAMDLAENAMLARMLNGGDPALALWASYATTLKWGADLLALSLVAWGLVWAILQGPGPHNGRPLQGE